MRVWNVRILDGRRDCKVGVVQDVVERFIQLLTGKENSVALIVGGVCMWGDASIKRVANTGIESEQAQIHPPALVR